MPSAPAPWRRLGRLLEEQRGRIEPNAKKFAARTGLNYRLIYDIEHAARTNYRPAKLAEVEHAYQWEPGSIQRVLDGGDPTPRTDTPRLPDSSEFVINMNDQRELQIWASTALSEEERMDFILQLRERDRIRNQSGGQEKRHRAG